MGGSLYKTFIRLVIVKSHLNRKDFHSYLGHPSSSLVFLSSGIIHINVQRERRSEKKKGEDEKGEEKEEVGRKMGKSTKGREYKK